MFDLGLVKAAIDASAPTVAQTILPDVVGVPTIDPEEVLTGILEPQFPGDRVYALTLPRRPTLPACVFQQVGQAPVPVDDYAVLMDYVFEVSIYEEHGNYRALHQKARTVTGLLRQYSQAGQAGSIHVEDVISSRTEENDQLQVGLVARMTYLAHPSQALPAVFIYHESQDPDSRAEDSMVNVNLTQTFIVLTVAKIPAGGISGLSALHKEILDAVLKAYDESFTVAWWSAGTVFSVHNGMVLWRDTLHIKSAESFGTI